jgi:hypothetical protein
MMKKYGHHESLGFPFALLPPPAGILTLKLKKVINMGNIIT